MAIDSAAKRRSAGGVAFLPLGPGVTPDATPDQFWRQSAAWSYGGILAASPAVVTGPPKFEGLRRHAGRMLR